MTDILNNLLKVNLDAAKGYSYAAENIKNDNFRHFLKTYADQRKRYAEELKQEILDLGGEPVENTSLLGDLHQALVKIKDSVSSDKDEALLEECSRGEGEAIAQYEKVIETEPFSTELRKLIMTQYDKIRAARSTMDELARVV
ncbi:PA2169 family four-helix-bundle protein [Cryomorphaceae bacterium 1068]|nr:PA2169 family four-helix-bundle protein [Cryomorphaceae bacterium 1068]